MLMRSSLLLDLHCIKRRKVDEFSMCFAQSVITYNQRGFTDKSIVARLAQASAAIDRDTLGGLISSHPFVCELLYREDSPPK